MADFSNFNPAHLRKGLVDAAGTALKPGLTTSSYSGSGTPTAANELKPSIVNADGTFKPTMLRADGSLKPSLLKIGFTGTVSATSISTAGTATGATAGSVTLVDGTGFNSGSANGSGLSISVTVTALTVTGVSIVAGGSDYLDTETYTITTAQMAAAFGGIWTVAPVFTIDTVV